MKNLLFSLLCVIGLIPAAEAYTGFGICNFGKETVTSIICEGPTVLKDTTVVNNIKVAGPFTAVNISADSLAIVGAIDILDSTIKGTVEATGSFKAVNTEFKKDLTLTSDNITFHKSKIRGSLVVNSETNTPHLVMECGSSVKGTVKFNGKAGVIEITDDSVIQGKVTNGSMIFDKRTC